jgi:hypothetical protein
MMGLGGKMMTARQFLGKIAAHSAIGLAARAAVWDVATRNLALRRATAIQPLWIVG